VKSLDIQGFLHFLSFLEKSDFSSKTQHIVFR